MKKLLFVSTAAILVIMVLVLLPESDQLQDGEIVQAGSMEISDSTVYKHEVYYPEKFSASPRVKIKIKKGSANLEVIEQRTDGFVFKASNLGYSVADGAHVEWTASGFVVDE